MATRYYWTGSGVTARANSTAYTAGARIVPAFTDTAGNAAVAKRYVWECTTGGTSGAAVPTWPASVTADTTTVTDGTVTWTARNPGYSSGTTENWTFATIYFDYAIRAANASGDVILVHYTSQEELTADTQYSFTVTRQIISVNKDSSNAVTEMGTGGWIGNSTTNRSITFTTGVSGTYCFGLTFRTAGSTADNISIGSTTSSSGCHLEFEKCYFWSGNTSASSQMKVGNDHASGFYALMFARFVNCTFRFGSTSQRIVFGASSRIEFYGCSVASAGSAPSTLLSDISFQGSSVDIRFVGCDLSHVTGTLIGNLANQGLTFVFAQCKLGANVTVLGTQVSNGTKSSGVAYVFDCSSGDTHTSTGYYDAYGSVVSDTGIYYTTGAAAQSWKIVTTANCSYYTPFTSPFVDFYNTGTSSITPRFEILRDGSTTAFQNDEVSAEFFVKTTSGSTQSTPYADRMTLLGTPANQAAGAGTGSWTGEAASAWSGKIDSGSAITPAESGHIRGRVVVGEPSITVYVDPQIRT